MTKRKSKGAYMISSVAEMYGHFAGGWRDLKQSQGSRNSNEHNVTAGAIREYFSGTLLSNHTRPIPQQSPLNC
jgi:hypothetical protein